MVNDSLTDDESSTTSPSEATADGRSLRRERNVETALAATVELLGEGIVPSLIQIAERSGVAPRSVYRYFGDAESAITRAVTERAESVAAAFTSEPAISSSTPFEERVAMLVLRRLRLDRLAEPISSQPWWENSEGRMSPAILDDEVRRAFGQELAEHADDDQLAGALCAMFRLRSVRSMRSVFGDDDADVGAAMARMVSALVADTGSSSD